MSRTATVGRMQPGTDVSIARLHGEACIACGAVHLPLYPAGTVTVSTSPEKLDWPVVACAEHRRETQCPRNQCPPSAHMPEPAQATDERDLPQSWLEHRKPGCLGVVVTTSNECSLRTDGPVDEHHVSVTAVIYDRLATPSRSYLDMRRDACREYAAERGWTVAAEHIDTGDAALQDQSRPGLQDALTAVRDAADGSATDRAVLLVYNDGRLSHDTLCLASWRYLVRQVGGDVAVVESSTVPSSHAMYGHAERRAAEARR